MVQIIRLKYFNKLLKIGFSNWKTVYLLGNNPVRLYPEVHRGKLVYRVHGSHKRISYQQIKNGLRKQEFCIKEIIPDRFF